MTNTCKHCGSPIEWAMNEKRMRVAVEKSHGGTLVLTDADPDRGYTLPVVAKAISVAHQGDAVAYRAHREVCVKPRGRAR